VFLTEGAVSGWELCASHEQRVFQHNGPTVIGPKTDKTTPYFYIFDIFYILEEPPSG